MSELDQATSPEIEVATPEPSSEGQPVEAGTTDPVVETDEQKNQREIDEQKQRDERKLKGFAKRAAELTADKYAERTRAERAERELEYYRQQRQPQQPPPQVDAPPAREQYDTYEAYIRAEAAFAARQESKAQVDQYWRQQQDQQQRTYQAQAVEHIAQSHHARVAEFAKTTPDFGEVVDREDVIIPDAHAMVIMSRPDSEKIIYAIGKNPSLAQEISKATNPVDLGYTLGRISASLAKSLQVSNAPPPGKPVGAKPGTSAEPPEDPDAYMAWAAKHMR